MSEDSKTIKETEKKKNELNEGELDKAVGGARSGALTGSTPPVPGTPIQGS
jgi:hypothetical protein